MVVITQRIYGALGLAFSRVGQKVDSDRKFKNRIMAYGKHILITAKKQI